MVDCQRTTVLYPFSFYREHGMGTIAYIEQSIPYPQDGKQGGEPFPRVIVWNSWAPIRVNFFAWEEN
ncbi:hypothetical protein CK203_110349 [Vitis vinifera]|uniref:Uncharacterized protein n=1 Tax=Vitis vinifera TaxID=29760 RepID=A0A438CGC7_VITVI|nr:hypothetical protein CK203_110349 [Vitis vinifera]